LDTPGHKDFAEDTYRTLTAVDSVILVIDCVKGVETQTEKLMEVCRMRDTPVIVFINKLDLEGRDPFELLDELEEKLEINVRPMSWPIGIGASFKGVYNLQLKNLNLFQASKTKLAKEVLSISDLNDNQLNHLLGKEADQLREDVELIEGVYDELELTDYLNGKIAPVFFGSAVNNFGVQEMLDQFIQIAPHPKERETNQGVIKPDDPDFSGFIFKIHANLDPNHRDRIAFLRVCSGIFERKKFYYHSRLEKKLRFNNPTSFMAKDKQLIEEAFPGDVIGLYDTGNFKIGDTLTEGEDFNFIGIPSFSPEIFKEVINNDPLKSKQLEKGIKQLTEEGVAQLFHARMGNKKYIGTVGELQFEVIQYRLKHEYNASCNFQPLNFYKACWFTSENQAELDEFVRLKSNYIVVDRHENLVFLAQTPGILQITKDNYPNIDFHFTSEFKQTKSV